MESMLVFRPVPYVKSVKRARQPRRQPQDSPPNPHARKPHLRCKAGAALRPQGFPGLSWGYSGGLPDEFQAYPGLSPGYQGLFLGCPGAIRGLSGGYPGLSGAIWGIPWGFPHDVPNVVALWHVNRIFFIVGSLPPLPYYNHDVLRNVFRVRGPNLQSHLVVF